MAKDITEKIQSVRDLIEDTKLEKKLRQISDGGNANLSVSISQGSTTTSFNATSAKGVTETYSMSVPYTEDTESPEPTDIQ